MNPVQQLCVVIDDDLYEIKEYNGDNQSTACQDCALSGRQCPVGGAHGACSKTSEMAGISVYYWRKLT